MDEAVEEGSVVWVAARDAFVAGFVAGWDVLAADGWLDVEGGRERVGREAWVAWQVYVAGQEAEAGRDGEEERAGEAE